MPAKEIIYLDNNATTPVDPRVLESMMPYLTHNFANASSTHQFGLEAHDAVKQARTSVATLLNAELNEIVFTSGATEAINLAIKGVAENYQHKGKHIITVSTEHSAVLDTCKYLETKGFEVTYLPVKKNGLVDLEDVKNALRGDTILVSVMYANNETGVIQPIKHIAALAHSHDAIFMTDATQAVGKVAIDVNALDIDLLTFSGHKLYAPKGIGALFVRQRRPRKIKLEALLHGGGHERGVRSGTLNVPGIVALGKACEIARAEMKSDYKRLKELRDYLESKLLTIEDTFVNGDTVNRMPNVTNICFKGADSDAVILGLSNPDDDAPLIAVSNGSACTSASIEPSHVLKAMGLSDEDAFSSIRFSLGRFNSNHEIAVVNKSLAFTISSLREMSDNTL